MKRKNTRFCDICGEMFYATSARYCPDCTSSMKIQDVPEPENKGNCVCWFDGLDYAIHECDIRRKLARERAADNKPYQMPQCGKCTEDMPKIEAPTSDEEKRCGWCHKKFEGRTNQVYCSNTCQGKRRRHSLKLRKAKK